MATKENAQSVAEQDDDSTSDGTAEKVIDKATEKITIERWHYTVLKVIAAAAAVSAIAHLGEAIQEILSLFS